MGKATLPINYIVALIFAVIIIAVIGYWFFVIRGKGGVAINEAECQARKVAYCTNPVARPWDEKAQRVCGQTSPPSNEECKKLIPS